MEVELRHLRSFLAVAEELHFGRAAERLHVAQPPLSQQIRRLEQELGAALFDRGSRPIRLTAAGAAFLEEARLAVHHADQAMQRGYRAARGEVGQLAIGATSWAQVAIVPAVVRAFRARAPEARLQLSSPAPTDQVDALRKERLDIGFVAFARWLTGSRHLQVEPLLEEPMVAFLASSHPLAEQATVSLEQLAEHPFITLSHVVAPGLIDKQMETFHERGVPPVEVQETSDPAAMGTLIAAGEGVGMHMASFSNLHRSDLTFIPIEGNPPTATLLLLWRSDDNRELVHLFLDTAREVARTREPPDVFNRPAAHPPAPPGLGAGE
jgi:DNA-binding transcriptional LysR family regulator